MKIRNLDELKKNINVSALLIFLIITCGAILGLYLTHQKFLQNQRILNKQEISNTGKIFQSNLSEKLSIIASSTVFLDYLRSGHVTRERLYSQFLAQIASLRSTSISGMEITNTLDKTIFKYGAPTPYFLSLKLCYLNQSLDNQMGDCSFRWNLFFRKEDLMKEMLNLNNKIKPCLHCKGYHWIDTGTFGNFPIYKHSDLHFKIGINSKKDYFFYIYLLLITFALILFGSWSWYRLSSLLNTYIANPLKKITLSLKENEDLVEKNQLEEIQFLTNEIHSWQDKIKKFQKDENLKKLGKIAAQLAHDVRSPLTVIDMLIKDLTHTPDNYKKTLRNATQRISDIANNFLAQYQTPNYEHQSKTSIVYVPSILENMVAEKRSQFSNHHVEIILLIEEKAWAIFASLEVTEFKRMLSNLINNAIEAIESSGTVKIKLKKFPSYFEIMIEDNGCGIAKAELPKVLKGGLSIGKKTGFGLGISHALQTIDRAKGELKIISEKSKGSQVTIQLRLANKTPSWAAIHLDLSGMSDLCILDDEESAHILWKRRLASLEKKQVIQHHYYTIEEFKMALPSLQQLSVIYLIDFDLNPHMNGLDIIQHFKLNSKAYLVTNRYDDSDLQKNASCLGIKIIPKQLIKYLPISY